MNVDESGGQDQALGVHRWLILLRVKFTNPNDVVVGHADISFPQRSAGAVSELCVHDEE